MNKSVLSGLMLLALSACASRPQPEPNRETRPTPPPAAVCREHAPSLPTEHPLQAWLRYQQELLALSRQGLEKRISETERAMNAAPTGEAVMRHALSLSMSSQAGRQERALRLLNNLRLDPRLKPEEQHLVAIQAHHLGELRAATKERQRLEQRLAQEQGAKDALEAKIKALTTIELRMNERQRSESPPETATPEPKASNEAKAASPVPPGPAPAPKEPAPAKPAEPSKGKPAAATPAETKPSSPKTDSPKPVPPKPKPDKPEPGATPPAPTDQP
ncbi:MAG: hypothetical protein HYV16_11835 [Gammaproteobacteria bacterium]|nr:hypothetical protein [Gammaproteobacteria bacterium]